MSKKEVNTVQSLSPTEQKIYSELYSERVVTTNDIKEILDKNQRASDYITNLRQKGYFKKIKKGLYAIAPPNMLNEDDFNPDKFLIANKIKDESYISHHSALEFHGLAQTIQNRVYITSKTPSKLLKYKNIEYKIITTKHYFGFEKRNHLNTSIKVSDREKTILDCIRNIKYAGGIEELIKSFEDLPTINWNSLLQYLEKIDEKNLYQKTGFIFERLNLNLPEKIEEQILSKIGKKTYYLEKDKDSFYVDKWNLMVPKKFEEWIKSA